MGNAPLKHALTVDVEDYFQVSAFAKVVGREDWKDFPSHVADNTRKVLQILERDGVKATFFVLGWVAEHHPEVVPMIAAAGHEIACHGYSHTRIMKQDRKIFREETRRAKAILEDQAGHAVHGYRAASFSIVGDTLWALDELAEAGFAYDSSIFPVTHDLYGIADSPTNPYTITTPDGHRLAEFPITVLPIAGYHLPVAGGGYFRLFPYWFTRWALGRVAGSGRNAVFYMHPWEVDTHQPRIHGAGLLSRFRHYNNLNKVEARLGRLLSDFSFTTCHEVLAGHGLLDGTC